MKRLLSLILALLIAVPAQAFDVTMPSGGSVPVTFKTGGSVQAKFQTGAHNPSTKLLALMRQGNLAFSKDYSTLDVGTVTEDQLDANFSQGSADATFTATRSSSAPATYVDSDGIIQLVTDSNVGRIQGGYYDETGFHAQKGLMIEGSSTNLAIRSHEFNYWSPINGGGAASPTVTADQAIAPDGNLTADLIQYPAISGSQYSGIRQIGTVGSYIHQASIYIKAANPSDVGKKLYLYQNSGIGVVEITITEDWSRWSTESTTALTAGPVMYMALSTLGSSVSPPGTDQDSVSVYVWGAQYERSPYPTSFIPTTTAALTRASETFRYGMQDNRNAAAESIFIQFSTVALEGSLDAYLLDNNGDRRMIQAVNIEGGGAVLFAPNLNDNPAAILVSSSLATSNEMTTITATTNNDDVDPNSLLYINSLENDTDNTNVIALSGASTMSIGFRFAQSDRHLFGIIGSITFYSDVKSSTQVSEITSILEDQQ